MVYKEWNGDIKERDIPISEPFKLEKLLTNDVEISRYVYIYDRPNVCVIIC